MRLKIVKSKNVNIYYVIKTVYINGKEKTLTVERIGNEKEVLEKSNGVDPVVWAKKYVESLNIEEKEKNRSILISKSQNKLIEKDKANLFNCGYFFLEDIYYSLKLNEICRDISKKYKFDFNLDSILSRLIYTRVIFPNSKLASFELSQNFIEKPQFQLQHIYRALEFIAKENDFIQAKLYENSIRVIPRNTSILYYDCTNFFFEIEEEDDFKKYGTSKEHRPNPIVQMGLFMDGNGIPLAFCINPGNTNEQTTLIPLEEKLLKDFSLSKFIVCTDAGLSSNENRIFNNFKDRAFITTQSVKKLKAFIKKWALDPNGWKLSNSDKEYNIDDIEKEDNFEEKYFDKIFYKERWITENNLEQKLIVSYSLKYRNYQRKIRNAQIVRANTALENKNLKLNKVNQNDFKRFIKEINVTQDDEVADKKILTINKELIEKEAQYDGFYAVATNLEDDIEEIIKLNQRRWEIEESFRIMKSEFKARPVYLSREDRIRGHFTICFLALLIHRILEKKLEEKYTSSEIIQCLRDMNLLEETQGYIPAYTRNDLTDLLHEKFGFRTDYEITSRKEMKKIFKKLKE